MSDGATCVACGTGNMEVPEQETCPECGSVKFEAAEGCSLCKDCGFSPCK